jgi:hypothetical protein
MRFLSGRRVAARGCLRRPLTFRPCAHAGYFSFDLPSITADDLKRLLSIDNEQYGLLFSGASGILTLVMVLCGSRA